MTYDLINGPAGYDIGSGIDTVEPPYRSGYNITVGSDANVTAYGVLSIDGTPASLVARGRAPACRSAWRRRAG